MSPGLAYSSYVVQAIFLPVDESSPAISNPLFQIRFIKTGTISGSPVTVEGSSLPDIVISISDREDRDSGGEVISTINFTGTLQIYPLTQTCKTSPNSTYDLGKISAARFTGKGSSSKWYDTSVILSGCDHLTGNHHSGETDIYNDSSKQYLNDNALKNHIAITLTPNSGDFIQSIPGTISLDNQSSATGVGIQLGLRQNDLCNVYDPAKTFAINPGISVTQITIPLCARIIQTEDTVIPGTIHSSITYSISYL